MKKLMYVTIGFMLILNLSGCGEEKTTEVEVSTQEEIQSEISSEVAMTTEEVQTETLTEAESSTEAVQPLDISALNLQYGQHEEFKNLYDQIQSVDNAEAFEGTWNRTEVDRGLSAEIAIANQDEEGFEFVIDCFYYSHMGYIEGKAYFIAPNVAIFEYAHDFDGEIFEDVEDDTPEYVVFEKTEEGIKVIASGYSADLGLGMSVFADGLYILGEPTYTNATVLDDNFTAEEQENIENLLGDDYDTYFKSTVEMGVITSSVCILEDGTNAVFYEAFIPTMGGYSFELLKCDNGDLYFYSEADEVGWKTNVSGAIDYPVYNLEEE